MPTTSSHSSQTKWKLCVLCQESKAGSLTSPSKSKRQDMGSGYSSLADNLTKFHELGLNYTDKEDNVLTTVTLRDTHNIYACSVPLSGSCQV